MWIRILIVCIVLSLVIWATFLMHNSLQWTAWFPPVALSMYSELHTSGSNDIYVLRTHRWDIHIEKMWRDLCSDIGHEYVYVAYDVTGGRKLPAALVGNGHVITHTEEECKSINRIHKSLWLTFESLLVLLYQRLRRIKFQHLWVIEYDVRCTGNWKHVLQSAVNHCRDADFVSYRVEEFNIARNALWAWWWNKSARRGKRSDRSVLPWRSFLPISRYSYRLLQVYDKSIGEWTDFCELYLPTRCMEESGFSCDNLSPHLVGNWYTTKAMSDKEWADGVGRPKNKLYHAIKS